MKVYILHRIDSYDRGEVVGVYTDPERARQVAQAENGSAPMRWDKFGDAEVGRASIFEGGTSDGYEIRGYEVDVQAAR